MVCLPQISTNQPSLKEGKYVSFTGVPIYIVAEKSVQAPVCLKKLKQETFLISLRLAK